MNKIWTHLTTSHLCKAISTESTDRHQCHVLNQVTASSKMLTKASERTCVHILDDTSWNIHGESVVLVGVDSMLDDISRISKSVA